MHENYGGFMFPSLIIQILVRHPKQEWVWTGPQIHPHLFRNKDGTWLYFMKEALPRKVFYNYDTQNFEEQSSE